MSDQIPALYTDLADWWPLLSAPDSYADESAIYRQVLLDACQRAPVEVLELGSGGGNNASHLKAHFQLTLVDRSPGMLAVSQTLNPECQHVLGDMRTVRLGRQFDAVFVHDAVSYLTSEEDLLATMRTAFAHCRPGGAALFCPDETLESFRPYTDHGGHDATDGSGRGLRYVEWVRAPAPGSSEYVMEMGYLLLHSDGSVQTVHDRHVFGVFSRETWLRLLAEAGFTPHLILDDHTEIWDSGGGELFIGVKPMGSHAHTQT